jgi:hypothetical protein
MHQPAGASVSLGGLEIRFKLLADQTGGIVSVVEVLVAPGRLALPHRHEREDELCLVMDGRSAGGSGTGSYDLSRARRPSCPGVCRMRTGIRAGRRLGWYW